MAQLVKVRLPHSTVLRGVPGVSTPPPPPWLPELQRHEWMALGAVVSGGLGVWSYILSSRGRHTEAATIGLLTVISGTVTAFISHMNAPVAAAAEDAELRRIVKEGVLEAQYGEPPAQV